MKDSKTRKTTQPTASSADGAVMRLRLPRAWGELTQRQLRYLLTLMAEGLDGDSLKAYAAIRFAGIKVMGRRREGWKCAMGKQVFYLQRSQLPTLTDTLKFIDSYDDMDVRLDGIHGLHAVNALLHQVPYGDYLKMEIAYQGFMHSRKEAPLRSLARLLYRDDKGRTVDGTPYDKAELLGAHLWYSHVKRVFAQEFPHFFKPANASGAEEYDIKEATDAQVRVLTDGDITKANAVFQADTWHALAELNAKAKEAKELKTRTRNS